MLAENERIRGLLLKRCGSRLEDGLMDTVYSSRRRVSHSQSSFPSPSPSRWCHLLSGTTAIVLARKGASHGRFFPPAEGQSVRFEVDNWCSTGRVLATIKKQYFDPYFHTSTWAEECVSSLYTCRMTHATVRACQGHGVLSSVGGALFHVPTQSSRVWKPLGF